MTLFHQDDQKIKILIDQGADETHAECVKRVQRSLRYQLHPQPPDHDAHVTAWRIYMWDLIEEISWLASQRKALFE